MEVGGGLYGGGRRESMIWRWEEGVGDMEVGGGGQ